MKLNIHIIYNRISTAETQIVPCNDVAFNLIGVRYYSSSCTILYKNIIYLISANDISSVELDTELNFICLGDIDHSIIKEKWSVIILPSDINSQQLYEKIQGVFEEYNLWVDEINRLIYKGDSLQSIFDKSSIYLKNPIALFDNLQGLLMVSGNLNKDKLDPIWSYVLQNGHSFKEIEDELLRHKINTSPRPFYYNSPDNYSDIKRLLAPVFINNRIFGVLAMTELIQPITNSEYAHLYLIKNIIENALKVNNEYATSVETPWYISKILTHKPVDINVVSHHLGLKGKRVDDKFILWCFSPLNNLINDDVKIQDYLIHISKLFKTGLTFCYENVVLVLDYDLNNLNNSSFRKFVIDFLTRVGFISSTSLVFSNILELNQAFFQCQIAIQYCQKYNAQINKFSDIYTNYILDIIEENTEFRNLILPELKRFDLTDGYHKELLLCLQAYIINGGNITATAKTLNIHRHTVVYRLDIIKKITEISYESLDEDTLLHLYLSCRILLRNL